MTRIAGYRLQGMGCREEKHFTVFVSSVNNADSVIQVVPSGAPSHCHPELVSDLGFVPIEGRVHNLGRAAKDGSSQRRAGP